jgi:cystinosin
MPRRHGGGSGPHHDEQEAAENPHALLQAPLLRGGWGSEDENEEEQEDDDDVERGQGNSGAPSCGARSIQCFVWARHELLGFAALLLLGLVLGLLLPKNTQLKDDPAYAALSNVLGWTYFLAWTVSFYPQLLLNYRQQTTEGLSLDFELLNLMGFLFYSAFALAFHTVPSIQQAYRDRHDGHENKVTIQDVVFAGHAVLITAVTIAQMFYYDGFGPTTKRLSRPISLVLLGLLATTLVALTVAGAREAKPSDWLDFLYILSYMKLFITITKGLPQAYLNYKRKSTSGWSIHNILCDFTGRRGSPFSLFFLCVVDVIFRSSFLQWLLPYCCHISPHLTTSTTTPPHAHTPKNKQAASFRCCNL